VCEGDDLNVGVAHAVDHEVWEAPQRHSAHFVLGSHPRDEAAQAWLPANCVENGLDFRQESSAEAGAAAFIPGDGGTKFPLPPPPRPAAASLLNELRFNAAAYVLPIGRHRLPGVEHFASPFDLGCPCLVHPYLWTFVKTLDQASGDLCALLVGQAKNI
jgi:hypothetical protein